LSYRDGERIEREESEVSREALRDGEKSKSSRSDSWEDSLEEYEEREAGRAGAGGGNGVLGLRFAVGPLGKCTRFEGDTVDSEG